MKMFYFLKIGKIAAALGALPQISLISSGWGLFSQTYGTILFQRFSQTNGTIFTDLRYDFIPKYIACKFWTYRNVLSSLPNP